MLSYIEEHIKKYDVDYIEIRIEDTISTSITISSNKIENISKRNSLGGSVRVLYNGGWGFASFNNIDKLHEYIEKAISMAKNAKYKEHKQINKEFGNYKGEFYSPFLKDPTQIDLEEKLNLMLYYNNILQKGKRIVNTNVRYADFKRIKYYGNSLGTLIKETTIGTGAFLLVIGRDGNNVQQAYHSVGEMMGFEVVEDLEKDAERIVNLVEDLLDAPKVEGGRKTVILDPKLTGVFTHEAFGHLSEADFLYKNKEMQEKMKIGTIFGPEFLNIVDDATIRGARGFYYFDDEGVPAQKTYLIKEGKLIGRLHSRETAFYMNETPTGNARALNYTFAPIVRMSCTFIEPHESKFEEMLEGIEDGIYACGMLGGNTDLDMFTFSAEYGYEIKNGKITRLVRDVILTGNVFETLKNIEMIGDDFKLYGGMGGCGKEGQSPLPVSDGGPHIRIKDVLIG